MEINASRRLVATLSKKEATEIAVKKYVRGGGNEKDGRKLLAEQIKHFATKNLPAALIHMGFATPANADKLALALHSE
jgi:hypothetical protein